jgi:phosphatidylglycerol:prolipoprotein diacylglycerol transferase
MLIYPKIDPVVLQIGPIHIHWYGIMYVLGFIFIWMLALYRAHKTKRENPTLLPTFLFSDEQIGDLIFYAALGVILGGRIGYMLFYDFSNLISNPLQLFKIWEGGMAFHGGLAGVLISVWLFARKNSKHFLDVTDFIAPFVPIGLGLGRIGNFINSELLGKVTNVPWGIKIGRAHV